MVGRPPAVRSFVGEYTSVYGWCTLNDLALAWENDTSTSPRELWREFPSGPSKAAYNSISRAVRHMLEADKNAHKDGRMRDIKLMERDALSGLQSKQVRSRPSTDQLIADARLILQGKMKALHADGVLVPPFLLGNVGTKPIIEFLATHRGQSLREITDWVKAEICMLYDFDSEAFEKIRKDPLPRPTEMEAEQ